MKKFVFVTFVAIVAISLSACHAKQVITPTQSPPQPTETLFPQEFTEEPTEHVEPTVPESSDYYIPGISTEDMITYFNEVVLNMEYTDGTGDSTLVQKWLTPIYYITDGDPTDEDIAVLENLFEELNQIPGFPGIYPADENTNHNLTLRFLDQDNFRTAFSDFIQGENADGAVQFWYYTLTNEIHTGQIGYRTDLTQEERNSVLLEEIINLLGISDTILRKDSIVYQYSSEATKLSEVDWVLLKLLYDPQIQCGMDALACQEILKTLYF